MNKLRNREGVQEQLYNTAFTIVSALNWSVREMCFAKSESQNLSSFFWYILLDNLQIYTNKYRLFAKNI